jgi:hypothetical protein
MTSPQKPIPICWICGNRVSLEHSKTDEHGKAVHEDCYLAKILLQGGNTPQSPNPALTLALVSFTIKILCCDVCRTWKARDPSGQDAYCNRVCLSPLRRNPCTSDEALTISRWLSSCRCSCRLACLYVSAPCIHFDSLYSQPVASVLGKQPSLDLGN